MVALAQMRSLGTGQLPARLGECRGAVCELRTVAAPKWRGLATWGLNLLEIVYRCHYCCYYR